ncbi:MAG TPA: hypothetical protein VHX88_02065 [Solirubrobacteraceae bacterium]|jgi:hypothetical protein|nr:hypothetical protein [Solirubrobacteraceae bacterium]
MSVVEARALAVRAHADQRDRDGSFHIQHVARVAEAVPRSDGHQRVAWLHDVLEDSPVEIEQLEQRLPAVELEALVLLTHDDEETYDGYVGRIVSADGEAGSLARAVKEADMLDNLRRSSLARDPAVARYGRALAMLWRSGQETRRRGRAG